VLDADRELADLAGDSGARALLDAHAKDCIRLEIDDEAVMLDFDAPNALLGASGR
jgi:CTP:molybdopterin cytidylyltransferase MocA